MLDTMARIVNVVLLCRWLNQTRIAAALHSRGGKVGIMRVLRTIFDLIRTTFNQWNQHNAPMMAASLAYFAAFSIAPLIVMVVSIAGLVISQDALQTQILTEIEATLGAETAELVADIIQNITEPAQGIISTVLSVGALLFGALGVFNQLQNALNRIWNAAEVKPPTGIVSFITDKLLAFSMIFVLGGLLVLSIMLGTVVTLIDENITSALPGSNILYQIANFALSFGITTLLFMVVYKVLPRVEIHWGDVWVGAVVTTLLFTVGRTILGLYLNNVAATSTYGAAGALIVVLIWVYYSAQIVLLGAVFTHVFTKWRHNLPVIVPKTAEMPVEKA